VLELDFRAVKFLFFPRRDLNSHHWYTAAPFAYHYVQRPRPLDHIYKLILESHVILDVFWLFKKLRLIVNERNLKIDVALKASLAVVITFGVIQIYFRLFALFWKNKYIFQYHSKKSLNWFIRIDQVVRGLHGVWNLIEVISSWTEQKLRSILK
jgi:hypothetical protein